MLTFMKEFFNLVSPADKILQSRDVGYRETVPVINEVVWKVMDLRSSSNYERILSASDKLLPEASIQSRPTRKKTKPVTLHGFVITDRTGERSNDANAELRADFNAVIDVFTAEMKRRFNDTTIMKYCWRFQMQVIYVTRN